MKLWAIYPELVLAGTALILVPIAGWARGKWIRLPGWIATAGFAAAFLLSARMLTWDELAIFKGTYAIDGFSTVFKLILELGGFVSVLLGYTYFKSSAHAPHVPVALLFATLGAVGLCSSLDLGLIVLFFQMMSFGSYLLVAMLRTDRRANEATLKFFIYAAVALAIMAYGLTFLFGLTGSLELREIGRALQGADRLWIALALGFVLIGFGFEATLVPFHFWAPDVYHGATAPVSGFLSVVPKVAALAALSRFLVVALGGELVAWPGWIAIIAASTMTFGNLVALRQTRLKRLLAYSSIAQAGYVLMAVAVAGRAPDALPAVGYYLAAYLFMNLGAFAVVAQLERGAGTDLISALRGLGRTAPFAAFVLTISLLSLAGIPPLAGFFGKILLLLATIAGEFTWLAVLAVVNMTIALYYYIAVVAEAYLRTPKDAPRPSIESSPGFVVPLALTAVGTFALGILPEPVMRVTNLVTQLVP